MLNWGQEGVGRRKLAGTVGWKRGCEESPARREWGAGEKRWHFENRVLKIEVSKEAQVWAMTVGID